MPFIHDDFLLQNKTASRLYHQFAEREPILDYHSHLPPADIAANRQFKNLFELWLEGDHYKWRAMRSNGVPERFCTGDAAPFEKFQAWAATVPHTLRNPLYHWTHLELKRYFQIDTLLDARSAKKIWETTAEQLASPRLRVHGILKQFRVAALSTTDDPCDSLEHHRRIAGSTLSTKVFPTFRPDKALAVQNAPAWNAWIARLEAAAGHSISRYSDLCDALRQRHGVFHEAGCRMSDHGLECCFATNDTRPEKTFDKARAGKTVSPEETSQFAASLMEFFGRLDAERGWTMQLHLGAMRNNSTRQFQSLGPDTGFDSIGDWPQARLLSQFLDRLDRDQALPKTILYNLNPADNYAFATLIGNFQDGSIPGKVQLGSGWWFLDQKEGIEWQLNALSNLGLLSRFVGMLTDSRSFMSFPRHEYFRRILCNRLGQDIENGEIPRNLKTVGPMIRDICFANAKNYLGFNL